MTTKSRIMIVMTLGILLVIAVSKFYTKKSELVNEPVMKSYAVIVSSQPVRNAIVSLSLPYLATVQSDKDVVLSSRTSSRILEMVKCGSPVKKGDILIQLDSDELNDKKSVLKLQIASTQVDIMAKKVLLDTALSSHERTKALLKVRGASKEQFDKESSSISDMEAALQSLKNQIEILNLNISQIDNALSYTILKSPINGVASECNANIGDIAAPGKPLITVESESGKYLLVRFSGNISSNEITYKNKIYPLIPMKSTFNGLNEYRAYLDTSRSSGERVTVSVTTYHAEGIKVPLKALLEKEGKTYCFVIRGEHAVPVAVNIIARGEEGVVVKGLKEGEELVIAQPDILLKLLSGVPLRIRGE